MSYNLVWIIDDDPIPRLILKSNLKKYKIGNDIAEFSNAVDAIAELENSTLRPDLIFLDINMPILTGWEFLEKVKKSALLNTEKVDVAIVTSSIDSRDRMMVDKFPCVKNYLTKPVDISFLADEDA